MGIWKRATTRMGALGVLLATFLLPWSSAAMPHGVHAAGSDTIVMAYGSAPFSIDPAISYDYAGPAIMRTIYEPLVRMQGTSLTNLEGDLATSWSSNAQKTVWTFHLRRGVLFHDGTPFNADAVKFSIERNEAINQSPAYVFAQFVSPKDVKIVDPYTVQFLLHAPAPRLPYALASQYGSYMVSPTAIKTHQVKGDWAQKWIAAGHDAGSGPYLLAQYIPNQSISFDKFPRYWRGWSGHHVGHVILQWVDKDTTRSEMIQRGDADIANYFTPQDMVSFQKDPNLIVDSHSLLESYLLVPTVRGIFASVKARLALSYAFDYNAYINGLLKGFAQVQQGPIAHFAEGHDNSLPIYQTDINKAKQLFTEAGVKPGTSLTMWYPSGDITQQDIALVTQGQLAQCGITVKIREVDAATYSTNYYGTEPISQRPDLWVGTWTGDYQDANAWFTPLYHSKVGTYGGANAGVYHDAQVDKLIEQAAVTVDPAARQRMLNQIQMILTVTDPAAAYIAEATNTTTYRRSLHGYYYNTIYVYSYDFYSMWK